MSAPAVERSAFELLLDELKATGEALGDATAHEQQLEDERPLLKELAIIRIMERDKCASTNAKEIVKSDLAYMEHRVAQRAAVIARFRAEAEYEAAKARVTHASLTPPDVEELVQANHSLLHARNEAQNRVLELEEQLAEATGAVNTLNAEILQLGTHNSQLVDEAADLTQKLREAKRETDLKQIALRRANGYLADRIRDVDELTKANRDLSAQLEVAPRKVPATLDSLEQSRDSLTAEVGP